MVFRVETGAAGGDGEASAGWSGGVALAELAGQLTVGSLEPVACCSARIQETEADLSLTTPKLKKGLGAPAAQDDSFHMANKAPVHAKLA